MVFEIHGAFPENVPPLIDGIMDYYEVEAEKVSVLNLGGLSDPEE